MLVKPAIIILTNYEQSEQRRIQREIARKVAETKLARLNYERQHPEPRIGSWRKEKTSSPIEPLRCKLCGGQLDNNLKCRHCGTCHQRIQKLVVSKEYLTPEQRIAYDNYLVSMQSPKTRQEQSALDRHVGYGGSKRPVSMENPGTTTKEYRQALKDKITYLKGGKKLSEQYYKKYGKLENMPPKKRKALEDFLNTTGGKIVSFKAHRKKVQFLAGSKSFDENVHDVINLGRRLIGDKEGADVF